MITKQICKMVRCNNINVPRVWVSYTFRQNLRVKRSGKLDFLDVSFQDSSPELLLPAVDNDEQTNLEGLKRDSGKETFNDMIGASSPDPSPHS